eukprot:CAMPEP_0118817174 /NCGR_PEP_ID=MMETSP1162-20130426/5248_1 /TAXON_ID=33656 /ORGANISM="Phaeocystis Sp, Strain CCMP2710" /LENGTH=223 /DNA_ID=CAMNT_0006747253 /DNA_START=109 /DNA_END=779 /DNA_ORIENTATION=+
MPGAALPLASAPARKPRGGAQLGERLVAARGMGGRGEGVRPRFGEAHVQRKVRPHILRPRAGRHRLNEQGEQPHVLALLVQLEEARPHLWERLDVVDVPPPHQIRGAVQRAHLHVPWARARPRWEAHLLAAHDLRAGRPLQHASRVLGEDDEPLLVVPLALAGALLVVPLALVAARLRIGHSARQPFSDAILKPLHPLAFVTSPSAGGVMGQAQARCGVRGRE